MKRLEKKVADEGIDAYTGNRLYVQGYNQGLQVERDWWEKWIDEAPIEDIIQEYEDEFPFEPTVNLYSDYKRLFAKAIRNLLKGN